MTAITSAAAGVSQSGDVTAGSASSNRIGAQSKICWLSAAVLLGVLCFVQLGMMISLLLDRAGMGWVAPAGLCLAVILGDQIGRREGLAPRGRVLAIGLALGVIAMALAISGYFFDFSWDGEWYHQTAILRMTRDWNPLSDPMNPTLIAFTAYFAKGPWYVAAAVFKATGMMELGKCSTLLTWAAMGLAVFAAGIDCGLRQSRAAAIAVAVAFNPVVLREMPTFLVDGIMIASLTVAIAAIISGLRQPRPVIVAAGIMATIVCLNAKLNGAAGLGIVFIVGGLWCAYHRRAWLARYIGLVLLAGVLGAGILGYNPYVTNTIFKHNPVFPTLTSNEIEISNEKFETPKNLLPHNIAVRVGYTIFGRPDNPPYTRPNAQLMWPFDAKFSDLATYHFQDPRVGALGPWFSGALVLSFILGAWMMFQPRIPRWTAAAGALILVGSLLIAPVLWWPRFAPQQWFLPILPALFIFWRAQSVWAIRATWALVLLLIVNAGIVGAVGMAWEHDASRTLRQQLAGLHQSGRTILVDLKWFKLSTQERLIEGGVPYRVIDPGKRMMDGTILMSVVKGYPFPVRYKILPPGK